MGKKRKPKKVTNPASFPNIDFTLDMDYLLKLTKALSLHYEDNSYWVYKNGVTIGKITIEKKNY